MTKDEILPFYNQMVEITVKKTKLSKFDHLIFYVYRIDDYKIYGPFQFIDMRKCRIESNVGNLYIDSIKHIQSTSLQFTFQYNISYNDIGI